MTKEYRLSCPMDCFDVCRFVVRTDGNRIVSIKGDPHHPVTQGRICKKGRALVDRHYHPDRLTFPMIRKKSGFTKITYPEALDRISDRILAVHDRFGPTAVMDYTSGGYGGLKGRIQSIFFNCHGGATVPTGSLCWGAGIAAQKYDFGSSRGHFPDDVDNADLVLVWGRNPKATNQHLYTRLKRVEKNGGRIVVIDPVRTATAGSFETHIQVAPSTDGALALGMASVIIDNDWMDQEFIDRHVIGFNRFKETLKPYSPEAVSGITGISAQTIKWLARQYAQAERAMIYVGYGMQRYQNSGAAVRCVDALGALTGKIGTPGNGVNYGSKGIARLCGDVEKSSRSRIKAQRKFVLGRLGEFLETARTPGIEAVFVAGANPLNQSPDLQRTVAAFSAVPFKVVFDHFLTDTARHADIVLPAATVFEQEDIFAASTYSPVLNYSQKVTAPRDGIMPEFEFYLALTRKMGVTDLGFTNSRQFLEKSTASLQKALDISFDTITRTDTYLRLKTLDIAWENRTFETPSGRYELYSETALADGLPPLPVFDPPRQPDSAFPLRLLTCHSMASLHSQGYVFIDTCPTVYIHPVSADQLGVPDGARVRVIGKNAAIEAMAAVTDDVPQSAAFIFQGFWHKSGAVNYLTESVISDMGDQAAFYDSFVRIEKC